MDAARRKPSGPIAASIATARTTPPTTAATRIAQTLTTSADQTLGRASGAETTSLAVVGET